MLGLCCGYAGNLAHPAKRKQHRFTKKQPSLKQTPACPSPQRNGYAGEARAEFQDAPSPPRTIPELSPCFFVTKRHFTARKGERQGERKGTRKGESR